MKHPEIIKKMTLEQKAAFVSGHNYWNLESAPELGLPQIMITDGPHGLRKQNKDKSASDGIGLGNSVPTTCFPPAATSSCSWDEELLKAEGEAMGEECLQEEVSKSLDPAQTSSVHRYAAVTLSISARIRSLQVSALLLLSKVFSQRV